MGNFWDRFTGKLIHQKIMGTYSVFLKNGSWARPFYWKTYPVQMLHIIYDFGQKIQMDEFSSKTVCVTPQNWKNWYSWFLMDEFSSKTACVTTRKMKILEKFWMSFPRFANKGYFNPVNLANIRFNCVQDVLGSAMCCIHSMLHTQCISSTFM